MDELIAINIASYKQIMVYLKLPMAESWSFFESLAEVQHIMSRSKDIRSLHLNRQMVATARWSCPMKIRGRVLRSPEKC